MERRLGEIDPFYFFSKIRFYKNKFDYLKKTISEKRNKFFPQFFNQVEFLLGDVKIILF